VNHVKKDKVGFADGISGQVMLAMRRITRAIDLRSRDLVGRYGLTGPQLAVLKELGHGEVLSVGQLAKALHLSQATVTGILDRMERRELVRRQRSDQDKRYVRVWLTSSGRDVLAKAPPLLQESFLSRFTALEDWEQTLILSSLQRVVAMLEARDLDATPILTTGPMEATPEQMRTFLGSHHAGEDSSVEAKPPDAAPQEADQTGGVDGMG